MCFSVLNSWNINLKSQLTLLKTISEVKGVHLKAFGNLWAMAKGLKDDFKTCLNHSLEADYKCEHKSIYYYALEYWTNSTKELFVEEADMMKMLESEFRAQDNSQWSTWCS